MKTSLSRVNLETLRRFLVRLGTMNTLGKERLGNKEKQEFVNNKE